MEVHLELFGRYNYMHMMPRPTNETLWRIRGTDVLPLSLVPSSFLCPAGTFQEFLDREDLSLLAPIFQFYTYLNGYGHLDEEAAYYGLLLQVEDWNFRIVVSLLSSNIYYFGLIYLLFQGNNFLCGFLIGFLRIIN